MTTQNFKKTFHSGSIIFREGEPGTAAYIIEKGMVEIAALQRGERRVMALLTEGEIFGEMALIDDGLCSATATAVQDTEVLVINREYVRDRLNGTDPLLKLFLHVILKRLRELDTDDRRSQSGRNPDGERHRDRQQAWDSRDQINLLQDYGCRYGQGFLFTRPMSEAQMSPLLRTGTHWHEFIASPVLLKAEP